MLITLNQSLMDVAMMGTGCMDSLFSIAAANGVSITDTPQVGSDDIIPSTATMDTATLQYLQNNRAAIGTLPGQKESGIGYMQIGDDFVVS